MRQIKADIFVPSSIKEADAIVIELASPSRNKEIEGIWNLWMEKKMIESRLSYDLLPKIDMKSYGEWVQKTIASITKQPGMVEFRANRNILGTPQICTVTVWKSLGDWSRFAEENTWQSIQAELQGFATNIKAELWGPSPVFPEPVRPSK